MSGRLAINLGDILTSVHVSLPGRRGGGSYIAVCQDHDKQRPRHVRRDQRLQDLLLQLLPDAREAVVAMGLDVLVDLARRDVVQRHALVQEPHGPDLAVGLRERVEVRDDLQDLLQDGDADAGLVELHRAAVVCSGVSMYG